MENMDLSGEILSEVSEVLEHSAEPEGQVPVTCVIEHTLLPEHLADYADQHGNLTSAQKADEKDLNVLRARHHGVARMLAEGIPEGVVAEMNGYDPAYLSTLKNNPSMVELIAFYRQPKNETAKVIGEKLRVVGDMSLNLLQERLETKGGEVSITELTAVAKLGMDRSGHGPTSTVHQIQEHQLVPSEELLKIAQEARRREQPRIVDVSAVRSALPPPKEQSNGSGTEEPGLADNGSDSSSSSSGS